MLGSARTIVRATAVAALLGAVACGDGTAPRRSAAPAGSGPRIVSLSPALTGSIERLGGGAGVVGCTPWCGVPGVPAVGSLEDRDLEAIAGLRPTLLVRQSTANDPALEAVLRESGARAAAWRLSSLAEVRAAVGELGQLLASQGVPGADARAAEVVARFDAEMAGPRVAADAVVFLYSTDPPAAFGSGSYLDDLWRGLGGTNAVAAAGYPSLTAEDILALRPAAVVVVGTAALPAWAGADGRCAIAVDAPELLEPGAAMLETGPASLRGVAARIAGGCR
jgi:ABC-type hemin transport system substrate-binding protein